MRSVAVDLRSDTITRPTPGMREAIANAEVGDDSFGDDPTVKRLEEVVAALLGKEAALFFPSGIMANQTGVRVLSSPGTEVVLEAHAHILDWEEGAPAEWSRVQLRPVPGRDGILDAERIEAAIRPDNRFQPRTSLICLENTHNGAGGRILPLENMRAIRELALARRIPIHLDGARLWNASAATGIPVAEFAAHADTVMVCLSKGLGCPVGSMLAGTREVMAHAWRVRRRLGGAMRQAGILAAAGLYALEHHRERLVVDHANARLLGELAARIPGLSVIEPETNIVMIDVAEPLPDAATILARLEALGIRMTSFGPRRLRAVTHLDVDEAGIRLAAQGLAEVAHA